MQGTQEHNTGNYFNVSSLLPGLLLHGGYGVIGVGI